MAVERTPSSSSPVTSSPSRPRELGDGVASERMRAQRKRTASRRRLEQQNT